MFPAQPKWVVWYITNRCNLHCEYCFPSSSPHSSMHLPKGKLFAIANELAESSAEVITIEGGEPLVVSELPEIVEYLTNHGKLVRIYTNIVGIEKLWNSSFAKLDKITTSFDDFREDRHNAQRGAYKQVVKGIKFLKQLGRSFHTVVMATPNTIDGLYDTVEFLVEHGSESISIAPPRPIGRGLQSVVPLTKAQEEMLIGTVRDLKHQYDGDSYIKLSGIYRPELFVEGLTGTMNSCLCGYAKMTVNWNGLVYPCSNLPYIYTLPEVTELFGTPASILTSSINQVWNSPIMIDWRNRILVKPSGCKSCPVQLYCDSGCMALNHKQHGEFGKKDEKCDLVWEKE